MRVVDIRWWTASRVERTFVSNGFRTSDSAILADIRSMKNSSVVVMVNSGAVEHHLRKMTIPPL